jgi:hypothetical protein
VIHADDALRGRARAGYYEFEQIVAAGVGQDLEQSADALVPRLAAATAVAGLRELYETEEIRDRDTPPSTVELLALVDRVVDFVRAGVAQSAPGRDDPRPRT